MIPYKPIETINLGFLSLKVWGFMVALGFLAGFLLAIFEAKRKNIKSDHIFNLGFYSLFGGIVGSRLLYVIFDWKYYSVNFWESFKIWQGGMVFHGGFFLAFLLDYIYIKRKKLNFWQIADLIVPCLALGIFIGRIGCFLIHDHLGITMKNPHFWAINYFNQPRHEIGMYLSLNGLLMFLFFWFIRKRIKKVGLLFCLFLLWYSLVRFFVDYLRDFEIRYLGLMPVQYISIIVFLFVLCLIFKKYIYGKRTTTTTNKSKIQST